MQIPCSPILSNIVKHYLIIESSEHLFYRFFSDGNPGIVFRLGDPIYISNSLGDQAQPSSFVYGQISNYLNLQVSSVKMLIVVLHPAALPRLFNIPASEMKDKTIALEDLIGSKGRTLEEHIASKSLIDAISSLEHFLIQQKTAVKPSEEFINKLSEYISHSAGNVSIEQLTHIFGISERQLERKFSAYVGISPKAFAETVKLQNFLKRLQKYGGEKNLGQLGYECGYYDQAHLNTRFKQKTGLAPSQYLSIKGKLSINLLPV
ncbi:helix-turn-helix transcriptional regulator [Pedobacter hiemivivus]|uniref:AraC family transcriptional regulator n=1 Tax=Pedobacter hiemivivus TaxID=2530454 RepID=A0A4V2MK05_9SPHI|nr:helix-turn-helix transcriptional regulator [Pedobacter hiemivivus]TCC96036.1 AraC family transcriptional regulator [Pedobacter hiemivivus]